MAIMDGPSDSDYEDLSFMEEYDFEDNLTFEMKEEIYGPDFESELQEDKEKEFKKNQLNIMQKIQLKNDKTCLMII